MQQMVGSSSNCQYKVMLYTKQYTQTIWLYDVSEIWTSIIPKIHLGLIRQLKIKTEIQLHLFEYQPKNWSDTQKKRHKT